LFSLQTCLETLIIWSPNFSIKVLITSTIFFKSMTFFGGFTFGGMATDTLNTLNTTASHALGMRSRLHIALAIAKPTEKMVNEYPALISSIYMSSQIPDVSKPGINTKSRPVVRSSYSQQQRGSYIPAGTLTHGVSMGSRRSPLEGIESRKSDSALLWVVVCLEESLT
jgi:hypothetical protein